MTDKEPDGGRRCVRFFLQMMMRQQEGTAQMKCFLSVLCTLLCAIFLAGCSDAEPSVSAEDSPVAGKQRRSTFPREGQRFHANEQCQ